MHQFMQEVQHYNTLKQVQKTLNVYYGNSYESVMCDVLQYASFMEWCNLSNMIKHVKSHIDIFQKVIIMQSVIMGHL